MSPLGRVAGPNLGIHRACEHRPRLSADRVAEAIERTNGSKAATRPAPLADLAIAICSAGKAVQGKAAGLRYRAPCPR